MSKGYDLDYIWKQVDRGQAKDAASYYIQASESGGEPPGRWWGPGTRALGLEPGQAVEREPYDLLFGERKAPDGTPLGRPPNSGRKAADLYAVLLAAEPHATAERRRDLRLEAARQARQSPLFFDLTISLSKSISIFHASLGENARLARQAGDTDGDRYWSALVTEVDDMIYQAVHAGFGYFQREAGYTRTGSHNARVHGRETGQWHEADLAVAHWLQHTSRDGDMQLHVHSQIAHIAKTATDGKWRAPDSLGYNEHIGAVAAIVSEHLEEALTRRFGLDWTARDDGHGFEITGISGEMMRVFSTRRESITADLRTRATQFEQRYGRAPSQRELAHLAQASNFTTRAAKHGTLDARAIARRLGRQAHAHSRRLTGAGRAVGVARPHQRARARSGRTGSGSHGARAGPRSAESGRAGATGQEHLDPRRCDQVPGPGPAPHRTEPGRGRRAAGGPGRPGAAIRVRTGPLPGGTRAGGGAAPACGARTGAASTSGTAASGTPPARSWPWKSAWLTQARADGAPRMTRAQAAHALGADLARLEDALAGRAHDAHDARGADARTATGCAKTRPPPRCRSLTDGRRVSVINAPAGSGKTRVLAEAAQVWAAAGLGQVIGITPSQSARNTLAAGVPVSYNSAQFLGHLPGRRGARGPVPIGPGTLLLIDEASMMSGPDLADLIAYAQARGGQDDPGRGHQPAPGRGKRRRHVPARRRPRLCPAHRTRPVPPPPGNRHASLRLRDGDTTVLAEYDQHGRIYRRRTRSR